MAVKIKLMRPDDLLNMQIAGNNLTIDASDANAPVLVVENANQPAQLIITFPPQAIAERAFFESDIVPPDPQEKESPTTGQTTGDPLLPVGQVPARMAHPSRLVFDLPADARIPYTTQGLLDWASFELHVSAIAAIPPNPTAAQISQAPSITAPQPNETALELPYRLLISPNANVRWLHHIAPFSQNGRTELWHTRMAIRQQLANQEQPQIVELSREQTAPLRAIWSSDYPSAKGKPTMDDPALGLTAMSPNDRYQIVILTSAFRGYEVKRTFLFQLLAQPAIGLNLAVAQVDLNPQQEQRLQLPSYVPYVPQPFYAEQLMLTPLGGWLKSRGAWNPPRAAKPFRLPPYVIDDVFKQVVFPRPIASLGAAAANAITAQAVNQLDIQKIAINPDLINGVFFPVNDEQEQLDLSEWTHVATQGRDHYVRIVYEGALWPFGHRAALIKVTERKFRQNTNGVVGAYMMQRMYIVVREPEKRYAANSRCCRFPGYIRSRAPIMV